MILLLLLELSSCSSTIAVIREDNNCNIDSDVDSDVIADGDVWSTTYNKNN